MRRFAFAAATATAALLATGTVAFAAPPSNAGPPTLERCFNVEEVERFHGHGDQTLIVRTRVDRYYAIGFVGRCPNVLRPDATIRLESRVPSSQICTANDLRATIIASDFPQTCAVASLTALSAAEVAALPARDRP